MKPSTLTSEAWQINVTVSCPLFRFLEESNLNAKSVTHCVLWQAVLEHYQSNTATVTTTEVPKIGGTHRKHGAMGNSY
jgi:hypothetical protein